MGLNDFLVSAISETYGDRQTCADVCGEESHFDTNRYDCCVCDLPRELGKVLNRQRIF